MPRDYVIFDVQSTKLEITQRTTRTIALAPLQQFLSLLLVLRLAFFCAILRAPFVIYRVPIFLKVLSSVCHS